MRRIVYLVLGVVLVTIGIALAPLPGPVSLPIGIAGTILILRSSFWARRQYVRLRQRWPLMFKVPDRVLRSRRFRFRWPAFQRP